MPRVGFYCPDSQPVSFSDCLASCRMGGRCIEEPLLRRMASFSRPWSGHPSVTQLLQPTRVAFLEITRDYYTDPQQMAWVLLGIETHSKLEKSAAPDATTEEYFYDGELSGRLDYYKSHDGIARMVDYKIWGAYSIAKAVGIFETGKRPTGTRGRDGRPIMEPILELIPEQADTHDITLQLNQYRMFKEAKGHRVDKMLVQAISRDGGTKSAREAGIFKNFYTIEVKRLPDIEVIMYFSEKRNALLAALEAKTAPRCTKEENWNGRRCNRWCNVALFCREIGA